MELGELLIAVAVGLVGGIASGLFGVGGGAIFVPAMVILLGEDQHTAQGVSLAVIVLTALAGSYVNVKHDNLERSVFLAVMPMAVIAVVVGSYLANLLSGETLQRIFGVAVIVVALRMFYASFRARRMRSLV
ncbi:MAG TPA: sulfite exporter TauE/SafE family protein [Dehalococcoidia bacterium]|nr:sulfite exporter TauE/SafE family protein [Dehalococcoidia bacterium]